jgi:hypothetical protein
MNLQDHQISYVTKRVVIKSLEDYAAGQESALELMNLRVTAKRVLSSDEGMDALRHWLKVFGPTRTLWSKFDVEYRSGIHFHLIDWRIMDNSVTKGLTLLEDKLINIGIKQKQESSDSK